MTIQTVNHITITVPSNGVDEAHQFYCSLLGLQEIPKPESVLHSGGFWLKVGSAEVHIALQDGPDRYSLSAHIAYQVDDAAAWREKLQTAGFDIREAIAIPDVERFYIRDPFGNRIEFLQRS